MINQNSPQSSPFLYPVILLHSSNIYERLSEPNGKSLMGFTFSRIFCPFPRAFAGMCAYCTHILSIELVPSNSRIS